MFNVYRVSVPAQSTALISGEAHVTLLKGKGEVLGREITPGDKFKVVFSKSTPFFALKESSLKVIGGRVNVVEGSSIPDDWMKIYRTVFNMKKPLKIIVLGGTDSGKTSFITFLANKLVGDGLRVCIIDSDVGQSEVGPPTVIGLGEVKKQVTSLSEAKVIDGVFVGSTSPSGLIHRSIAAVSLLTSKAMNEAKCDVLLIDTTGWVRGAEARELKIFKALAVNPDLIIGIEKGDELSYLLRSLDLKHKVLRIKPPEKVKSRSREERKGFRGRVFKQWFRNCIEKEVNLKEFEIRGNLIFTGEKCSGEDIDLFKERIGETPLHLEVAAETLIVVLPSEERIPYEFICELRERFNVSKIKVVSSDIFNELLVAFGSKRKNFEGLGVVKEVNFEAEKIRVITSVNFSSSDKWFISFGYIKVDPSDFKEKGGISKGCI